MAIVRVWMTTHHGLEDWPVDTVTRQVSAAERGYIEVDRPLCLEDLREPGKIAVSAFDEGSREWLLNLETFRTTPIIAGGDDWPVPPETCSLHDGCKFQTLFI